MQRVLRPPRAALGWLGWSPPRRPRNVGLLALAGPFAPTLPRLQRRRGPSADYDDCVAGGDDAAARAGAGAASATSASPGPAATGNNTKGEEPQRGNQPGSSRLGRAEAYEDELLGFDEEESPSSPSPSSVSSPSALHPQRVAGGAAGTVCGGEEPAAGAARDRAWLDMCLALLPPDGSALPLTTITPALPVEDIAAAHGTVAKFLQRCAPHRVKVAAASGGGEEQQLLQGRPQQGGRLFVSLAKHRGLSSATTAPSPQRAEGSAQPPRRRLVLQKVAQAAASPASAEGGHHGGGASSPTPAPLLDDSPLVVFLKAALVRPMPVAQLLHQMPPEAKAAVRRGLHGGTTLSGLLRSRGGPLGELFEISGDGACAGPKGSLPAALLRQPSYFAPAKSLAELDEEWNVELDLDDADGDGDGDGGSPPDAPPAAAGSYFSRPLEPFAFVPSPAPPAAAAAPYTVDTQDGRPLLHADTAPAATVMVPPPGVRGGLGFARGLAGATAPPPLPSRTAAISAAVGAPGGKVSAGGARVGWRPPSEMLSLFVECIPAAFPVPVHLVILTPGLKDAMGRASLARLLRTYAYYFDLTPTGPTGGQRVQLKPAVAHPRKGAADNLYAALRRSLAANPQAAQFPTIFPGQCIPAAAGPAEGRGGGGAGGRSVATLRAAGAAGFKWGVGGTLATGSGAAADGGGDAARTSAIATPSEAQSVLVRALMADVPCDFSDIATMALSEAVLRHPDVNGDRAAVRAVLSAHGDVFLLSDDGGAEAKLRPINVAPGAWGDLDAQSSPLPAPLVAAIVEGIKTTGIWVAVDKLHAALPRAVDEALLATGFSFLAFLRHHGKALHVSADGTKVRRYAMHPDVDESSHFIAKELRSALSTVATADTTDVPLPKAIAALPANWRPLLDPARLCPGDTAAGVQTILRFLKNYPALFVVSVASANLASSQPPSADASKHNQPTREEARCSSGSATAAPVATSEESPLQNILIGRASAFRRMAEMVSPAAAVGPSKAAERPAASAPTPTATTAGTPAPVAGNSNNKKKAKSAAEAAWQPPAQSGSAWASFASRGKAS